MLQTIAAAFIFNVLVLGFLLNVYFSIFLIFFTSYWWLMLLYIAWILLVDYEACEKGGRRIDNFLGFLWVYTKDYFPVRLVTVGKTELDPKRNYLFCCFPHGYVSVGGVLAFMANALGFRNIFVHHKPAVAMLKITFFIPFQRELFLWLGCVSVSAKSINYLLGRKGGGNALVLVPGGAEEVFFCKKYQYKVVLKNRKGFIKLALKNGSPLVPVISFGENETYDFLETNFINMVVKYLKRVTGVAFVIPQGRWYTLLPKKVKITVAGK